MQSVLQPHRALQHHAFVDEDADAVRQKAAEEKKEEAETSAMAGHDKPTHVDREVEFADETFFKEDMARHPAPSTPAPELLNFHQWQWAQQILQCLVIQVWQHQWMLRTWVEL